MDKETEKKLHDLVAYLETAIERLKSLLSSSEPVEDTTHTMD